MSPKPHNQDSWSETFRFIDKLRMSPEARNVEFILIADSANNVVVESEVQQRQLGKLLSSPLSRQDFNDAFNATVDSFKITAKLARILVVDEDHDHAGMIARDILGQAGFHGAAPAVNLGDALRAMNSWHGKPDQIDLIISATNMASGSGLDLLKRVRADSRWEKLPFILFTENVSKDAIAAAQKAGANDLVLKPIAAKTLIEKVVRHLSWFHSPA